MPSVVYEDEFVLAVDKPAGWSVGAKGLRDGLKTDLGAVLQAERGKQVIAAHRIDPEVSGVVVCAKNKPALDALSGEFQSKMARRVYHGLVVIGQAGEESALDSEFPLVRDAAGTLPAQFSVQYGLGPDLNVPGRMHVYRKRGGKPAVSHFNVLENFGRYAWIEGRPETSRDQQLQAHLAAIGAPVLGDDAHGLAGVKLLLSGLKRGYKGRDSEKPLIDRVALHLSEVTLRHPETKEWVTFRAPLPLAFEIALKNLRKFVRV